MRTAPSSLPYRRQNAIRLARRAGGSTDWGERVLLCDDPFGNPLCFVSRESMFL
jgi:hypothetical protein